MCDAVADSLLWRRDAHGGGGVQGTHGEDAEQDLPQSGGGLETGVLSRGRIGAERGEHVPVLCVAPTKAVGGREEGAHVARPPGGVAGGRAHVGDQQDVRQAGTDPGSGHGLRRGVAWDLTLGQEEKSEYQGAARAQEGYEGIQEGGPAPRGVLSRRRDGGMGCIQVDDEKSARTR